jgi:hypothetical protein
LPRAELGAKFAGELVGPADPAYKQARAVYNAMNIESSMSVSDRRRM